MRPAVSAARDIGASLFNDKCVRASLQYFLYYSKHMTKMSFTEYHDMINALPADRTDQPFCVGIFPG